MKTLLLGFEDIQGRGQSTLLAGPEADVRKANEIFNAAKTENKFPKGITRIESWGEFRGRSAIAICVKANAEHEQKRAEAIAPTPKETLNKDKK